MKASIFNNFLTKQDSSLNTGKTYRHNFQGMTFESENCLFYVWHKKEIKLIDSKNLGSTNTVFYIKDSHLNIKNENIKNGILKSFQIFSGFNEENGQIYNFLPYFQTKQIEEKNNIFNKLRLNISLEQTSKGIIIKNNEGDTASSLDQNNVEQIIGYIFGLFLTYGKLDTKGDKLSSIKIQIPLFGQFLSIGDQFLSIQKTLQKNGIFIQVSENIQGEKHIYEITSNDYELLEIFSNYYNSVEKFSQITKREQTQEAINSLKIFLQNEGENSIIETIDNSCVKILQKI